MSKCMLSTLASPSAQDSTCRHWRLSRDIEQGSVIDITPKYVNGTFVVMPRVAVYLDEYARISRKIAYNDSGIAN